MKRSEMVEKIKQAIIDGYIKADEILHVVEEAGMLPPHVPEPCETHVMVQEGPFSPPEFLRTEDSVAYVSKWEDETES